MINSKYSSEKKVKLWKRISSETLLYCGKVALFRKMLLWKSSFHEKVDVSLKVALLE